MRGCCPKVDVPRRKVNDNMMQERVQISEVQRIVGEKVDMRGLLKQLQHLFSPSLLRKGTHPGG